MGGKTKQTQRTKNNVRPSSSGRSAELLNNVVRLDPGLLTPSGGKALPVLFPTLASPLDPSLNPDFTLCLKKLNKKDPITKTKALQELCDLVKKADVEDVVAALPSWAHYYRTLTTDTDHKVRECAQITHGVIASACGRRLAPQLRALLPPWLQAQHDEYAPAAAAARGSLKATFPENKLPDVISFCMTEVIAHLLENLVGNGAETALSKKTLSPEEQELQRRRLVAASLQGLEFFAQHLPPKHDAWLWAELEPMLQASSFWKMPTDKSQHVKASWYGALGRIIARYPEPFGAAYGRRAASLLLASPAPHQQLWTCLLVLMRHVKADAWLDKKELLIKRILDLLESGGWGDAKHLSSMLLPLLAYLPEHLLTKDFYETFFTAIFKGLEKKGVMSSKSERQAWITSLSECLRYLTLQQQDFVVEVATAVHRTWLEHALTPDRETQTASNLIKHSATSMAALVKYWLRQSKDNSGKYDQLVRNFWQNVASTVVAQINKLSVEQSDISSLVNNHILLLQTLKNSFAQESKKVKSIKFDDDLPAATDEHPEAAQQCDAAAVERYKHNLDGVVEKILAQYFEFASEKQVANTVFSPLITLLIDFDEKSLFVALSRHFEADSIYDLYDRSIRGWLAGDTMRCKPVVDIVFLLLNHMAEKEQETALESFKQFPPSVVEWCIALSLSHPYCLLPATRRWLRGELVEATLLGVCRRMIADDDSRSRSLLLMCLATDDEGDIMISTTTVSKIISLVCAALSPTAPSLERLAGAAAALASELCGVQDCGELATALFRLQLDIQLGSGELRPETWRELRGAWQDAGAGCRAFRDRAVRDVALRLQQDSEELDIAMIEHVVSLCPYLLPQFGAAQVPTDLDDTVALLQQLLARHDSHVDTEVQAFALRYACVRSTLNCPLEDSAAASAVIAPGSVLGPELTRRQAASFCRRLVFGAGLLRALLLHGELDAPWGHELCRLPYVEDQCARLLHDYAVLQDLDRGYAFWEHYDIISRAKVHVCCALEAVTSEMTSLSRRSLRAHVARRAAADGYYWARAKRALGDMLRDAADADPPAALDRLEDIVTGSGFFHTLQTESESSSDPLARLRARYMVMLRSYYLAHAHERDVIDAAFVAAAAAADPADPGVVVQAYYRHQHTMLYDSDISQAEWRQVVSNTAIVSYLAEMVDAAGWDAAAPSWDFATISLCSLAAAVANQDLAITKVAMLAVAVFRLFLSVHGFVQSLGARCLRREPAPHVAALAAEWRDIFAPDTHYNLFTIIVRLLSGAEASPPAALAAVLDAALPVARALDWHKLPQAHQSGSLSIANLVAASTQALGAAVHPGYKYLAHALLHAVAKPLVLHDAEALAALGPDGARAPRLRLAALPAALAPLQALLDAALAALKVGEESCEMVPFSDSHSVALGYLLLADATFSVCQLARGDLVHHYIELCREARVAEGVAPAALRLLPRAAAGWALAAAAPPQPPQCHHMFLDPPHFSLAEPPRALDVGRLACWCVRGAARAGGGALRGWWGAAPARAAQALERLLRAYVAPRLVQEQLQAVLAGAEDLEDAEVTVHWSTSEVECVYLVEERRLELSVSLGAAHPLPLPRVVARGAPHHNTNWLAVYLAYQNGSVLHALRMWLGAVQRRVSAAAQCYVCYCRLHPGSGRLPKVACHQCRNKFHAECLRKWFTTSSKSNCPLCRANF